jgi:dolichol-phosphate mannosyltransferase
MGSCRPIRCESQKAVKTLIVIPTYDEAQNIERFVRSIFNLSGNDADTHILVVDDNSPDGTASIVENLQHRDYKDRLFLIVRNRKLGLGSAYIRGFQWGLGRDYHLIVEMDADFSHNPSYLPGMISEADHCDCVIGSRYVSGGDVRGWGLLRKIISRGGSLYARLILGVPIHDLTGGFNLWKRKVLERIDLTHIESEGYAFQIELKYRAIKKGFRFVEFPIIFENRRQGKSKMSKRIILEAVYRVCQLKMSA